MGRMPVSATPTMMTWEGDIVPPVTSYASTRPYGHPHTVLGIPQSRNTTRSAVVDRRNRRRGLLYFYSHGAVAQPAPQVPTAGAGGVRSSLFQQWLVQLHDWCINVGWHAAGYPRNLGLTFRVPQLQTQIKGAPGPGEMQQRPLFPRVQTVPRYSTVPPRYPTRAAKS